MTDEAAHSAIAYHRVDGRDGLRQRHAVDAHRRRRRARRFAYRTAAARAARLAAAGRRRPGPRSPPRRGRGQGQAPVVQPDRLGTLLPLPGDRRPRLADGVERAR